MKVILSAVVAVAVASSAVITQTPPPMKPGPEQKRIGYFAGKWNYQGEAKASPLGPAGKLISTDTCEWFAGGFHLVCRNKGTGPRGAATGQSVTAFESGAQHVHLQRHQQPRRQHLRARAGGWKGLDLDR